MWEGVRNTSSPLHLLPFSRYSQKTFLSARLRKPRRLSFSWRLNDRIRDFMQRVYRVMSQLRRSTLSPWHAPDLWAAFGPQIVGKRLDDGPSRAPTVPEPLVPLRRYTRRMQRVRRSRYVQKQCLLSLEQAIWWFVMVNSNWLVFTRTARWPLKHFMIVSVTSYRFHNLLNLKPNIPILT